MAIAVAVAIGTVAAFAGAAIGPKADQRINMRVLVLAETSTDGNSLGWQENLRREGVPFDVITGATTLTEATFATGETAKYQAVIVSGANGTAGAVPAGFTVAEFQLLWAFENKFGIRQLDVNAYPGPPLALNFPTSAGTLDGQTANLTATGLQQFSALKGPVPFEDIDPAVSESFGTAATPCDGVAVPTCNSTSFETILADGGGNALIGIAQTKDGRENMVTTFSANQFQLHNALLRQSMLSWVTRGVYLGINRSFLAIDVDDIFLPDDKWDPVTNTTNEGGAVTPNSGPQQDLRMTAADVTRVVNFQNTNGVKLNMLFNGAGVAEFQGANGGVDPLFNALMANKAQFPWINHTWSHASLGSPNPENPSRATIESEISQNNTFATTNALPGYNRAELVTGEHSGIGVSKATALGPVAPPATNMPAALNAQGVTTVGADNSREIGQRRVGNAYTLPRYPMNVFYNVATWFDQLDEYDWIHLDKNVPGGRGNCTPPSQGGLYDCFSSPVTQAQFIQRESTAIVRNMLGNDPRPHYAHQSNLISDPNAANVENRGDGILQAVVAQALSTYRSYFNRPFVQPTHTALREELRRQIAWSAAVAANQASGYIQNGKVTITSTVAVSVPITGTTAGDLYGGQRSGWTALAANKTATLDMSDPRNTVAPVMSGTGAIGSTMSTTNGTWTGTPTITYRQQWQRRANTTAPWVDIAGATTPTYTVVAADNGQQLRAVISAGNRISSWGIAVTTAAGAGTAPVNTAPPTFSGTMSTNSTLTADPGTWTGVAPITFAYQWQRRTNSSGSTWTSISGATARTFTLRSSDSGYLIRVGVTGTNSVGTSAQVFSSQRGPVTQSCIVNLLGICV